MRLRCFGIDESDYVDWQTEGRPGPAVAGSTQPAGNPDKVKAGSGFFVLQPIVCCLCFLVLWVSELWTLGNLLWSWAFCPGVSITLLSSLVIKHLDLEWALILTCLVLQLPRQPVWVFLVSIIKWGNSPSEYIYLTDWQTYVDHR